jgi:hypothetical protein
MYFINRNLASPDKQEITPIVKNTLLSGFLIIKFNTKYIPENHAYRFFLQNVVYHSFLSREVNFLIGLWFTSPKKLFVYTHLKKDTVFPNYKKVTFMGGVQFTEQSVQSQRQSSWWVAQSKLRRNIAGTAQ